jgi:SRSO17 transposase
MTRDEVRTAGRRVARWHERFAGLFGRNESREHSEVYIRGLMSNERRKNVEAIALRFANREDGAAPAEKEVVGLQGFVTASPWEWGAVQREIQAVFAEELVPSTSQWSIGTVGVIDESAMVKRGTESVGVARQYCGRLGKIENCQVGVYLVGVTPGGTALLDHQLFLPKDWAKDRQRRNKTHVPKEITFQTKPEIGAEMIRRTREAGQVLFSWIIGDELYGVNGKLLDSLEGMDQRYLMEVGSDITVWTEEPGDRTSIYLGEKQRKRSGTWRHRAIRSVKELSKQLSPGDWKPMQLREGTKGPLVYEFARVRVWAIRHGKIGIPIWLVFQRSLDAGEVKYYVSNADGETSLEEMALVTGTRYRVEEYFKDCKSHLGMAHYETRAWTSWHHHMSLVGLAHLYVTLTKREMKREIPDLTLDMAVRVLRSAFARGELTEEDAISILEYHRRRNRIASESHRKSWLRKHKNVKPKVLL